MYEAADHGVLLCVFVNFLVEKNSIFRRNAFYQFQVQNLIEIDDSGTQAVFQIMSLLGDFVGDGDYLALEMWMPAVQVQTIFD